ncbi:sensor histidine kinase [Flexivirga oryzae]|uniref:histidine kinase n=1 Tax=Flexivirga oryzae TaxID=1794944 RepID=A0A839NE83_9MICO|nr:sensor histidine kinase [Flexivirga oryzae]MBB2894633.1 signal transduction histidine kinase [Flexivirga oryzae]
MDWSLRRKVVAALAIPLIFATVLVCFRIAGAWSDAGAASQAKSRYAALEPSIDYLAASQDLAAELVRPSPDDKTIETNRARFGAARTALTSAIGSSSLSSHQRSLLNAAVNSGDALTSGTGGTGDATSLAPGAISSDVLGFLDDLNAAHPEQTLNALHDVVTAQSHLADERLDLARETGFTDDLRTTLSADVGGEQDALERVQAAQLPTVDVSTQQAATVSRLAFSTNGTFDQVKSVTPSVTSSYRTVYRAAVATATDRVSAQADDSRRSALLQIGLILAILLLTVLLALLISRRLLVRPIARLRRSTIDVAEEHLPAAIERVQSGQGVGRIQSVALPHREEIGQLSRAIDGMQNRAIRLASEQATLRRQMTEMFETLSRRNTSLVNQQLNLLEQLERSEDDSARLDSLFRLDHMAARMRRNGQSLMVLAGNEGRHRNETLAIAQVVGAAISEVQDYQRVDVAQLPDQIVDPEVATDLVHVVAELVDNALAYSPPQSRVQIGGARAIDGGVLLEIEDHGLGIEADQLEKLNDDISAGGEFGVETTRHMGLFVVARLGESHGIDVRLRANPSGGTVAAVHVPVGVLRAPEPAAPPARRATPAPARAERATAVDAAPPEPVEQTEAGLPRRRPGATGVSALTGAASLGAAAAQHTADASDARGDWVSPIAGSASAPERSLGAMAFFSGTRDARPGRSDDAAGADGVGGRAGSGSGSDLSAGDSAEAAAPPAQEPRHTPPRVEDTPIFRSISSRWLGADGELPWSSEPTDRAWEAAQAATEEHAVTDSDNPLPRRQPGRYIVPGSVESASATGPHGRSPEHGPLRDPEALRAKLSRYKQGVERARRAAAADDFDQHNDDNGSRSR